MNGRAKKILYGSLLAGSTALLVPTVLNARKEAPRAPPEVAAEGPVEVVDQEGAGAEASLARAGLLPRLEVPAPAGEPAPERVRAPSTELDAPADERAELEELASRDELVEALETSLGALENFAPAAGLPDLDRMAGHWSGSATVTSTDGEGSDAPPTGTASLVLDPLVEYLQTNRLAGIIRSETDSAALVGGRIVRSGDELIADARVTAIEPRYLVVSYRGDELRVELPPLRPRPRPGNATEGESDTSLQEESPDGESSTPETTTEGGSDA